MCAYSKYSTTVRPLVSGRLSVGFTPRLGAYSPLLRFSAVGGIRSVLTAGGATVEKVSGHLSFPLHFDEATALQLVALVVQNVVQISGHL